MASAARELITAAGKKAIDHLAGTQVFYFEEADVKQLLAKRFGFEVGDPALAYVGYAAGSGVVVGADFGVHGFRRVAVVEDDVGTAGDAGDEAQGRPDSVFGEVGDDSEPGEEGLLGGVEAGGGKAFGQRFALEVDGREGQPVRDGDFGFGEALALPGLGCGMVDFKDAKGVGVGATVGEGVEAGAENDELANAGFDRCFERVLGEAAAHGDEHPHLALGVGLAVFLRRFVDDGGGVWAEDRDGEGVAEDQTVFNLLVRRAVGGGGEGRLAGETGLHSGRVSQPARAKTV